MFLYLGMQMAARGRGKAEAVAWRAMFQLLWKSSCKSRMRWCMFSCSTYSSNLHHHHHHLFMWGTSVGSLWREDLRYLHTQLILWRQMIGTCCREATEHSTVQWLREGVVCFWTTSGSSSDMVGVISSCSSQQCSSHHMAGTLQRIQSMTYK